jgi:hypothetical protein
MALLETEATRLGYHYVYLWTQAAVGFYRFLGYMMCERVSLHRACLQSLERDQVDGLERMLSLRIGRGPPDKSHVAGSGTTASASKAAVTPADFAEDTATDDDVWLKKRLVESVESHLATIDQLIAEMEGSVDATFLRIASEAEKGSSEESVRFLEYRILQMPWQRQIGPSCGLAALRMVRDYFEQRKEQVSALHWLKVPHSLKDHVVTASASQRGEDTHTLTRIVAAE